MPPSLTSGSSIILSVQNTDIDIGLRHGGARSEALVNQFESGEPAPEVLGRALELLGPASAL